MIFLFKKDDFFGSMLIFVGVLFRWFLHVFWSMRRSRFLRDSMVSLIVHSRFQEGTSVETAFGDVKQT